MDGLINLFCYLLPMLVVFIFKIRIFYEGFLSLIFFSMTVVALGMVFFGAVFNVPLVISTHPKTADEITILGLKMALDCSILMLISLGLSYGRDWLKEKMKNKN